MKQNSRSTHTIVLPLTWEGPMAKGASRRTGGKVSLKSFSPSDPVVECYLFRAGPRFTILLCFPLAVFPRGFAPSIFIVSCIPPSVSQSCHYASMFIFPDHEWRCRVRLLPAWVTCRTENDRLVGWSVSLLANRESWRWVTWPRLLHSSVRFMQCPRLFRALLCGGNTTEAP